MAFRITTQPFLNRPPLSVSLHRLGEIDEREWDRRVKCLPEGTLYQTTLQARIGQLASKDNPLFLTVTIGHEVVGQLLFFENFYSPNALLGKPVVRLTLPLAARLFRTYTWYYGPLIFDKANYKIIMDRILAFIDNFASRNAFLIRDASPPIHSKDLDQALIRQAFISHGFRYKEYGTFVVDLTRKPDVSLAATSSESSSGDPGVEEEIDIVEAATREDVCRYHQILSETHKRNGMRKPHISRAMEPWLLLNPLNMHRIFLAEHQGQAVSGIGLYGDNGILFPGGLAISDYEIDQRLFGNHLLHWFLLTKHIIRWGQENGYRYYDFAGVNPDPETRTHQEEGWYAFKSRWDGELLRYDLYSKVYSPNKERLVNLVNRWKAGRRTK